MLGIAKSYEANVGIIIIKFYSIGKPGTFLGPLKLMFLGCTGILPIEPLPIFYEPIGEA